MNNPIEVMSFIIMFFGVIFLLFMLVFALDSLIRYYFKKKEEKFIRNHPNFIDLQNFIYEITKNIHKEKSNLRNAKGIILEDKEKLNYYPKNSERYQFLLDEISEKQIDVLDIEERIECLKSQRLDYVIRHESDIEEISEDNKEEYKFWKEYIQKIKENKY